MKNLGINSETSGRIDRGDINILTRFFMCMNQLNNLKNTLNWLISSMFAKYANVNIAVAVFTPV